MVSNTKEQALEAAIEQALTGQCLETLGKGIGEGAAFFKIVVAQSCFKQPLSAPARVSRAAPDLASRHR